jgi:hypothetical protein
VVVQNRRRDGPSRPGLVVSPGVHRFRVRTQRRKI